MVDKALTLSELQCMARDYEPVWYVDSDGESGGVLQWMAFDDCEEEVYVWLPEMDPRYPNSCSAYSVRKLLRDGAKFYRGKVSKTIE